MSNTPEFMQDAIHQLGEELAQQRMEKLTAISALSWCVGKMEAAGIEAEYAQKILARLCDPSLKETAGE